MENSVVTLIITIINLAIIILIIAGAYLAIRYIKNYMDLRKETNKKLDLILKKLDDQKEK
ncbi:MAG: hypothetical protein AB6733_23290 [Clostridiaceae bacterium]